MTTAVFITEKGGVGKTTVTLGMASAAMAAGHRALVVDADPQASATRVLGATAADGAMVSALDAPRAGALADAITPSGWGELVDVAPADRSLRDWEPTGNTRVRALKLARALRGVGDRYDVVLIDCPPGLGPLAVNALAAADRAVMIADLSAFSVAACEPVADLVDDVWQRYNQDLDLAGVVVNRVPPTSSEADRQYDALGKVVGRRSIWKPPVPQRVIVNEAIGAARPIHSYGSRARDVPAAFDSLYRKLRRS